jgi:hypothetical protein
MSDVYLIFEIDRFKNNIDSDLSHLDLTEFVKSVALTPKEKKQAEKYLIELRKPKR